MSARDAFVKLFAREDIDVSVMIEKDGRALTLDLDDVGVWAYRNGDLYANEMTTAEDVERELAWLDFGGEQ